MKLNSKVTGGLAWAGLVLVLAVPSADMLTRPAPETATVATATEVATAPRAAAIKPVVPVPQPVEPAARPAERGAVAAVETARDDVVDGYLASGKKLPSYISDAPESGIASAPPPSAPVTTSPLVVPGVPAGAGVAAGETAVASLAPVPYPASLRPRGAAVTTPAYEAPLVLDEDEVARREATLRAVEPVLDVGPRIIADEELDEWDSGSLAEYLERKGLIDQGGRAGPVETEYEPEGIFLDEAPSARSGARVIRRLERGESFLLF